LSRAAIRNIISPMNFSTDALLTASPKDAAKILYDAGRDLRGKNLRRGSWLEIAHALRAQRALHLLLPSLQAATTREDALRVLRLARKWTRARKSGGAKRAKAFVRPTFVEPYDPGFDDELFELEEYYDLLDEEMWGIDSAEYAEWLSQQDPWRVLQQLRAPQLRPANTVQVAWAEYALTHRLHSATSPAAIRSRIDDTTFHRLQQVGRVSNAAVSAADRQFLARYQLTRLLNWLEAPERQSEASASPITAGYELAAVALLDAAGSATPDWPVNWSQVADWLVVRLLVPPDTDHQVVWMAFHRLATLAPVDEVQRVLHTIARWPEAWLLLAYVLLPRRSDLLPVTDPDRATLPQWEQLLIAGLQSRLLPYELRHNWIDLIVRPIEMPPARRARLRDYLLTPIGSLRRMDYPAFTLTCRPSISLIRQTTLDELRELLRQLLDFQSSVNNYDLVTAVIVKITLEYTNRHGRGFPPPTMNSLNEALTRHTAAYVVLKTRVLHEALAREPFRLRRKHIQRFWAEREAGQWDGVPISLAKLEHDHGRDVIIEGLGSALLDVFKNEWPGEPGETIGLKEECIYALRWLAFLYGYTPPPQVDLDRAAELADYLLQRLEHAPLELAQALVIPHDQGLPLLAGGQLTPIEREYHRLLREAAGAAHIQSESTLVKTYVCSPIDKLAALERGSLGGDCSSDSVPYRALLPHYTYYGVFENGEQRRGYLTVLEAWTELDNGERVPVLCLETINVPIRYFDAVQADLLVIFEAIAHSRGLSEGLVLITGIGTWNYRNGEALRQSRRFRQGLLVTLIPADPMTWQLYSTLTHESSYYSCFTDNGRSAQARRQGAFRVLAPRDPALELIQPENEAEADRLRSLPPRKLIVTARHPDDRSVAGFISELPTLQ
jgi:hypothetical protein